MSDFVNYTNRSVDLPPGCKDLIDVLRLQHHCESAASPFLWPPTTVIGEIIVPEPTTVAQLAALLDQKPARIIADLMALGVFASASQMVDFETVLKVAEKYGLKAKRPT